MAIGEVGLAGELRPVPDIGQRLSEAARLGFTHAVIPTHRHVATAKLPKIDGMTLVECDDVHRALIPRNRSATARRTRIPSDLRRSDRRSSPPTPQTV